MDSIINRIVRCHAVPTAWAPGLRKAALEVNPEKVLFLPDKEAQIRLLEMKGDLAAALEFRDRLREALSEVSHIPELVTSKMENAGQLSGRALQLLYGHLIDRTVVKRRFYGRMITEMIRALLVIGGQNDKADISLVWGDFFPADPREVAEVSQIWANLGVKAETLLVRGGFEIADLKNGSQ